MLTSIAIMAGMNELSGPSVYIMFFSKTMACLSDANTRDSREISMSLVVPTAMY